MQKTYKLPVLKNVHTKHVNCNIIKFAKYICILMYYIPSGIMKFNGVESAMLATDVTYGDHRWAVEDCLATQSTVSPQLLHCLQTFFTTILFNFLM